MQMLKDEIRDRIMTVARKEFYKKGFLNASMRVMADKAGVSASNVYNYFTSKEEIFHALTDTVFHSLKKLINDLLAFREDNHFDNERFLQVFTELVPGAVFNYIRENRIELLLILECSGGTTYAGVKDMVIDLLAGNFIKNIEKIHAERDEPITGHSFLMKILAMNLIQGLVEIARHYKNDQWAEENIRSLMKYHIRGMVQFFT